MVRDRTVARQGEWQGNPAGDRQAAWRENGYFFVRGMIDPNRTRAVEQEVIDTIRADPPARHRNPPSGIPRHHQVAYLSGPDYLIYPESAPSPTAVHPEDHISKVFNCHASGMTREVAQSPAVVDIVAELLGPDLDCFQSQFIFKNPGVIGQPWHQDSFYFRFDRQPQVGVWLALSEATLENGCLWVVPGSHRSGVLFEHVPDRRPAANRGYLEIVDQDVSRQVPALMQPGDVLFFHSYLMHRSTDNVAKVRRAAMVYHYAQAGTQARSPEEGERLNHVNRWVPVRRRA